MPIFYETRTGKEMERTKTKVRNKGWMLLAVAEGSLEEDGTVDQKEMARRVEVFVGGQQGRTAVALDQD